MIGAIVRTFFVLFSFLALHSAHALVEIKNWECQFSKTGVADGAWIPTQAGLECSPGSDPGFIFYRANLEITESLFPQSQELGIFLGRMGDADETYFNGKLIGKTGTFPPEYINTRLRLRTYYFGNSTQLKSANLFIKIYSEFPFNRGLFLNTVKYGSYKEVMGLLFWEEFSVSTAFPLLFLLFLITTMLCLFLWVQNPSETFHLWAAGTVLFMASYSFCFSKYSYEINLPNFTIYRSMVNSAMLTTLCLALFSNTLVKSRASPLLNVLVFLNAAYFVYIQKFSSIMEYRQAFKYWFVGFVLITLCMSVHFALRVRTHPKVKFVLAGTLIFLLTALNDITITLDWRDGTLIAQYGIAVFALVFILTELYILTQKIKGEAMKEADRRNKDKIAEAIFNKDMQIAHDVRSPLTALKIALHNFPPDFPMENRILALNAMNRIQDIAKKILQPITNPAAAFVSKTGGTAQHPDEECVDLNFQIESIVKEKQLECSVFPNLEIQMMTKDEAKNLKVRADPVQLRIIISNVVNNAREAMQDKGLISVSLEKENSFALVKVVDTGCGIAPEHLDMIGQRGASFGKSGEAGSGLGIFHAKSRLKKWGGHLTINSSQNSGTTLSIFIPLS